MAASIDIVLMWSLIVSVNAVTSIDLSAITRPETCKNHMFCDVKPENYPESYFENVLTKHKIKSLRPSRPYSNVQPYTKKIDEENCSTIERVVTPYIARSNTTDYLVIQTKYFEQKVLEIQCVNTSDSCFGSLTGMTSTCKQGYGTVYLFLYHPITKQPIRKRFEYPSCCSCGFEQ